jgi:hypothetical protein
MAFRQCPVRIAVFRHKPCLTGGTMTTRHGAGSGAKTVAGKLFAGRTAIDSVPIVMLTSAIVLAPIAHCILHRFRVEA